MITYEFDNSGSLVLPTDEELKQVDTDTAIIAFTSGTMKDGQPYYAYVAVKPSKYIEFYEVTSAKKPMVLKDYGAILASGFGTKPPEHIVRRMREEYNYDEEYARKLKEAVIHQRVTHGKKQEEKRLMDIVGMLKAQTK